MSSDNISDRLGELKSTGSDEAALICSWPEFRKVVTSRRSVRVFEAKPVPEEVVQNAIDMALIAPTSSNLQQAEFYWVRSSDNKSKLVKYCLGQPAAATAAELIVVVARRDTWRANAADVLRTMKEAGAPQGVIKYYEKIVPIAYNGGPLGILNLVKRLFFNVRGLFAVTPREPKSKADMRVWAHKSAALAAENFMLAIRAQGFDSCPMEGHDSLRVRSLLGLPSSAEINMVISVGKRASGGIYGPRLRLPRSRFVFEI
jgi:nitroreductase